MLPITRTDEYDLWVAQTGRPFTFTAPFAGQDFALLAVAADPTITVGERTAVSQEIVRQGCRYAVCAGHQCSRLHDAIDFAYLATDPDYAPPDERFIMTTWHDGEPLEEVAHSFRWDTTFDDFVPRHYLALVLGGDAGTVHQVRSALDRLF